MSSAANPTSLLEAAAPLTNEVLVAVVSLARGSATDSWSVMLESPRASTELDARSLLYALKPSEEMRLITLRLPDSETDFEACQLVLRQGDDERRLAPASIAEVFTDLETLAREGLGSLDAETRHDALRFLADAPQAHGLANEETPSGRLRLVRNVLRRELPRTRVAADSPCGVNLENVYRVDARTFWFRGWVRDPVPEEARLTIVSPEGCSAEIDRDAIEYRHRPDVDERFGSDDPDRAPCNRGVSGFVELARPSYAAPGWILEMESASGEQVEAPDRITASDDPEQLMANALRPFGSDASSEGVNARAVLSRVLPVISRLQRRLSDDAQVEDVVEVGHAPSSPDVSIVIALDRRTDLIEHQFVQFAADRDLADAELIYGIDRSVASTAVQTVDQLHALYGVPARVAIVSDSSHESSAAVSNAGASISRGRLLSLFGGDVFPTRPGWLSSMRDQLDSNARAGAVGAKLLHEDDSIQHAGIFVSPGPEGRTEAAFPFRGLHRDLPGANQARRVDAVAGGCLIVETELFRALGGFSGQYIDSQGEDVDLCLRLAESGLEAWYEPGAELYCLAHLAWPGLPSGPAARYNAWLLDHLWADRLRSRESASSAWLGRATPISVASPSRVRLEHSSSGDAVEVLEVLQGHGQEGRLLASSLDQPRPSEEDDPFHGTYSLALEGWAVAPKNGQLDVEFVSEGQTLQRVPASVQPADLADRPPSGTEDKAVGFSATLGSLGLPREFEIDAEVVFADGERVRLGRVRGRRRPLQSGFPAKLQPLLVTTLGRTGSSWLMLLLAEHPGVAAFRPFQGEPRVASYWLGVLRALAEPRSYMQTIYPELYAGHWWIGDERPSPIPTRMSEPEIARWLGRENIELLAGFCQSRIEDFYSEAIRLDSARTPRYYAEKCWPEHFMPRVMNELYVGGKEIILVRDFRDMVSSILDFNQKRGFASFGRENADSDESFVRELRASAVRVLESWQERSESAYLLRYEDLIRDPDSTLSSLFAYLDVDADAATVGRVLKAASRRRQPSQRRHRTSSSPEASVGRWQRDLPPNLVPVCNEAFGDVLVALGYSANGAA